MTGEIVGNIEDVFTGIESSISGMSFSDTLRDFQEILATDEAEVFSGQHDSSGSPWSPLEPSTIKRNGHDRILFETGALMASLTEIGGSGNISDVFDRDFTFGTDIEYAIDLQEGTSRMPARPPVGLKEGSLDLLVNKIADATVDKLKARNT